MKETANCKKIKTIDANLVNIMIYSKFKITYSDSHLEITSRMFKIYRDPSSNQPKANTT